MSRFVSAGTAEEPPERDDEWLEAQKEIDRARQQKQNDGKQDSGKSLYEVLQANKAAKQEAFEEAARLKNQFRSLDEDEVDFLDSVLESTRANDAAIRRDTLEQLEQFRKQRETAEKVPLNDDEDADEVTQWKVGGKRRRKGNEKEVLKGVKWRKSSSSGDGARVQAGSSRQEEGVDLQKDALKAEEDEKFSPERTPDNPARSNAARETSKSDSADDTLQEAARKKVLGLSAYSSDSD